MNNILELFNEISAQKEMNIADFIEERLDNILRVYEEDLEQNCDYIIESDLILVVKELSKNAKSI